MSIYMPEHLQNKNTEILVGTGVMAVVQKSALYSDATEIVILQDHESGEVLPIDLTLGNMRDAVRQLVVHGAQVASQLKLADDWAKAVKENERLKEHQYNIGDLTMKQVFEPTGMTNVSELQAVFDAVEKALEKHEKPHNIGFKLAIVLRDAFMAGAGYKHGEKVKLEDIDRWAGYTPPTMLSDIERALGLKPYISYLSLDEQATLESDTPRESNEPPVSSIDMTKVQLQTIESYMEQVVPPINLLSACRIVKAWYTNNGHNIFKDDMPLPLRGLFDALSEFDMSLGGSKRQRSFDRPHPPLYAMAFDYINHRGELAYRRVTPITMYFGNTKYHPKDQWMLYAFDWDKGAYRDFAFSDIIKMYPNTVIKEAPTPFHAEGDAGVYENPMTDLFEEGDPDAELDMSDDDEPGEHQVVVDAIDAHNSGESE